MNTRPERTFGRFLRTHRIARGLSQRELSEALADLGTPLSRRSISQLELDQIDPHFSTVRDILAALEVPFSQVSTFFDRKRKGGSHVQARRKGARA